MPNVVGQTTSGTVVDTVGWDGADAVGSDDDCVNAWLDGGVIGAAALDLGPAVHAEVRTAIASDTITTIGQENLRNMTALSALAVRARLLIAQSAKSKP